MIAGSHKSKQYGLLALKVLILTVTFGYIYWKIDARQGVSFSQFVTAIHYDHWASYALFLGLAAANWYFEIIKWQTVISPVQQLTFSKAAMQSLAALTVSLATPNRIGEYGAKAYFFPVDARKRVLLLNFYSSGMQMGITCLFGSFGLAYVAINFGWSLSPAHVILTIIVLIFFGITGFVFRKRSLIVKGLTLSKVVRHLIRLPRSLQLKTGVFSLLRYLAFSVLFYLLLNFYGAVIPLTEALPLIFSMYFLVSIVPTIFIFDVVVRGGIAVWLFDLAGVSEWSVISAVFSMWMLNFVIPAVWGSYYVITYRRA